MFLGDVLGVLWFDVLRIRRDVVMEGLGIAFPDLSLAQRVRLGRGSCRNMGRSFIEVLILPGISPQRFQKQVIVEGEEYFWEAQKQGRGVLLLSMHLGSADFSLNALAAKGIPVQLITKTFSIPWLNRVWFELRGRFGVRFIADRKSTFDILRGLREGNGVIFVQDQFTGPPIGVETIFFGKKTGTAMGLALFSLKSKAPVLPVYTYRREDNKTVVVFERELTPIPSGDKKEYVRLNTQLYTDKIEELVRKYPEFWLWVHRRWKEYVIR
jgi:KDO2-lipid IV(A) lauroyltransferase